jgi:hypothetical protein
MNSIDLKRLAGVASLLVMLLTSFSAKAAVLFQDRKFDMPEPRTEWGAPSGRYPNLHPGQSRRTDCWLENGKYTCYSDDGTVSTIK